MTGSDWATYKITPVDDNLTVTSTSSLAVGVFGANSSAGFGGYFSGFGSAPNISFNASLSGGAENCDEKVLEVTVGAGSTIQWYKDGVALAGETGTTYTPTVSGAYYVEVVNGACTVQSNTLQVDITFPQVNAGDDQDICENNQNPVTLIPVVAHLQMEI